MRGGWVGGVCAFCVVLCFVWCCGVFLCFVRNLSGESVVGAAHLPNDYAGDLNAFFLIRTNRGNACLIFFYHFQCGYQV